MKKLTVVLMMILTAGISFSSIAKDNPKNEDKAESKATQAITKQIEYPAFAREQKLEGDVFVSFTVNKDGRINILQANSNCEPLKNYVIEKLNDFNFSNPEANTNEPYHMKFAFRLY